MKVLIACEFSGLVREAFTKAGADATSCDLLDTEIPGKHHQGDVLPLAYGGGFDMMVAFPPCTHLAVSGARWFPEKRKDGRQQQGIDFFMQLIEAPIAQIAVENPIGIMSTHYKKPAQIVQPYYFGDPERKATCLWLKNLAPLVHIAEGEEKTHVPVDYIVSKSGDKFTRIHYLGGGKGKERSKTFPGIARAMAEQWA